MSGRVRLAPTGTLTVKQVCDLFGVSRVTVHNWRRYKGMPHDLIPCNEQYGVRFNLVPLVLWAESQGIPTPGLDEVAK